MREYNTYSVQPGFVLDGEVDWTVECFGPFYMLFLS